VTIIRATVPMCAVFAADATATAQIAAIPANGLTTRCHHTPGRCDSGGHVFLTWGRGVRSLEDL
jgi:hypothetical protein